MTKKKKLPHSREDLHYLTEETDLDIKLLEAKHLLISRGCLPYPMAMKLLEGTKVDMVYVMDSGVNPSMKAKFSKIIGKPINNGDHFTVKLVVSSIGEHDGTFYFADDSYGTPFRVSARNYRKSWRLFLY